VESKYTQRPVDPKTTPKHDSWWPKHTAWSGSGLDFGVWTPGNEHWYARRKMNLTDGLEKAVQAKDWKNRLKFERKHAIKFLAGIRSVAASFIENRHL